MNITEKIDNVLDENMDPDTINMLKNLHNILGNTVNKENIKMVMFAMAQVYDADKKMVMQTLKNIVRR